MQFSYKAKNSNGETKYGKIKVKKKEEFNAKMRNLGMTVISSRQEEAGIGQMEIKLPKIFKRASLVDKMLFTRHLHVMLKAGLPFSRALTVLAEQTSNSYFREVLESIRDDVQKGDSLGESMEKYPKVFNDLFVNMIKVGETGGNLEEVLNILALQLKKDHDLVSKVKGAMMYPAVIIFAMFVIGTLMMIYVVPTILKVFEEVDTELPVTTQVIIIVSNTLRDYGPYVFLGAVAGVILFTWTIRTKKGKKGFDYCVLRMPAIGGIVKKVNMARFSRTLSSMISSGVSIVRALEIISDTLGNTYYKESIKRAAENVQKGLPLSDVVGQYPKFYQPLMIHMIQVGEETGTLEDTLKQVAEFYEEEVDQVTSNLSSIIEPALMLIIGAGVGFFAVSIIQPMYAVMGSI